MRMPGRLRPELIFSSAGSSARGPRRLDPEDLEAIGLGSGATASTSSGWWTDQWPLCRALRA